MGLPKRRRHPKMYAPGHGRRVPGDGVWGSVARARISVVKRICSWCKKPIGDVDMAGSPSGLTTHGICAECAETLFSEMGTRVRKLLDKFNVPVVVVNGRYEVAGVNESAKTLLGQGSDELDGHAVSEVFECADAPGQQRPADAGRDEGCEIRAAIAETLEKGSKLHQVPARVMRRTPDGEEPLDVQVSTERVGSMVLLKIDDSQATDQ